MERRRETRDMRHGIRGMRDAHDVFPDEREYAILLYRREEGGSLGGNSFHFFLSIALLLSVGVGESGTKVGTSDL